jgi:hypothetical protein
MLNLIDNSGTSQATMLRQVVQDCLLDDVSSRPCFNTLLPRIASIA